MTTTLVETSPRYRRAHCLKGLDRHIPARPAGLTDAFDARRRLNKTLEAVVPVSGVELLSASLDPFDGSMRIELLAPMLSAEPRSTAVPDTSTNGMTALEFTVALS